MHAKNRRYDARGGWARSGILILLLGLLVTAAPAAVASTRDAADCDAKFLTVAGGMRAYWTFDDPGAPATDDYDGHHGINHGAAWVAEGVVGGALSFDGIDDFVEVPHDAAFNFPAWDSFTIAVWFLNDGGGDAGPGYGQKIFAKNTWNEDLWMSVLPSDLEDGKLQVVTCHDTSNIGDCDFMYDETHDFTCGQWHHAVLVKNGAHGELWVDGVQKDTSEEMMSAENTQPLYIGFSPHPDHFQQKYWSGLIDELAIFDRVLTTAEIIDLYETSSAGSDYCAGFTGRIWSVPADAPTIQAGVDSAAVGDVVEVACGTYLEHDIVLGSGIWLRSESGSPDCVTVDAQQQGRLVQYADSPRVSRIEGLTFTGGASDIGAGVHCQDAALRLTRCVFRGNMATVTGGGLYAAGSDVVVEECTFSGNAADQGGVLCLVDSPLALDNTLIAFNEGASIHDEGPVPFLTCNDLYGNTGGDWIGAFADQVAVRGNFAADPCFCDADAGVLTLCADSFCLPGHHPWGCDGLVGALGEGCGACDCPGPVACRLRSFTVARHEADVVIRWHTAIPATPDEFRLVVDSAVEERVLTAESVADGGFGALDRGENLVDGGVITYRLYWASDDSGWQLVGSRDLSVPPDPGRLMLREGHPNPFNPRTTITYELRRAGWAEVSIYDPTGRRVATLTAGDHVAGEHTIVWNGRDTAGRAVPSGSYVVRLETDSGVEARKVMLVR